VVQCLIASPLESLAEQGETTGQVRIVATPLLRLAFANRRLTREIEEERDGDLLYRPDVRAAHKSIHKTTSYKYRRRKLLSSKVLVETFLDQPSVSNKYEFKTRAEAASYLRISPKTLANMAAKGIGPKFTNSTGSPRGGITRYATTELERWVLESGSEPTASTRGQPVIQGRSHGRA
jgi:hypothetical protein